MARKTQSESTIYEVAEGDCLYQVCPICGKGSDATNNDHACRVCGRVYHRSCCENDGKYTDFDLSTLDRAFTKVGWSCLDCDDIAQSALTPESHMQISDIFQMYDKNDDGSITLEEYLEAQKHTLQRELTKDEYEEEVEYFKKMDRDNSGEIELQEFLAQEAIRYIRKYDKEDLIRLMTPLEKKSAKRMFDLLDKNKDGVIDMWESIPALPPTGWYSLVQRTHELQQENDDDDAPIEIPPDMRRRRSSVIGQNLPTRSLHVRRCDENRDGKVTWPEFLRGHALDIIIARPNKSKQAVALLG